MRSAESIQISLSVSLCLSLFFSFSLSLLKTVSHQIRSDLREEKYPFPNVLKSNSHNQRGTSLSHHPHQLLVYVLYKLCIQTQDQFSPLEPLAI